MKKVSFPAGKIRQVCVNRSAIQENMRTHKNYPTILVVEDGTSQEFHAVNTTGVLSFDITRTDLPAKVFIETADGFDAFIDPKAEQTFKGVEREFFLTRMTRWMRSIKQKFFGLPVVSCFNFD
jgi:hypothetical protein